MKTKKNFNHCPKCDAGPDDIDWGTFDFTDSQPYQEGTCKKCSCVFKEWYEYSETTWEDD